MSDNSTRPECVFANLQWVHNLRNITMIIIAIISYIDLCLGKE